MTYNKSEIMKKAHSIRKETGMTMSDALRKAWLQTKIEAIKDRRFMLNMIDRQSKADKAYDHELSNKLVALKAQSAAISKKYNELAIEELKAKIALVPNNDWTAYRRLQSQLDALTA